MTAISGRSPSVTVEFMRNGKLVSKSFADAYKARAYYGKNFQFNPKVKKMIMSEAKATTETKEATDTTTKKRVLKRKPKAPAKKSEPKKAAAKKVAKKKAPTKKAESKKAEPKKAPTKKAEPKTKTKTTKPKVEKKWNEKKLGVFKALKALKATSVTNAVTFKQLAEKSGLTTQVCRHYSYKSGEKLVTLVPEHEDDNGSTKMGVYVTAEGLKELTRNAK